MGFILEQTLGHITHCRNLKRWACEEPWLLPLWMPVEFEAPDAWQRAPLTRSNWTLRASLRARALLARAARKELPDALLFHTQVTSLFAHPWTRRVPTVISLDATPLNVDTVGAAYGHRPSASRKVESLKNRLTRRPLLGARRVVTWCEWARDSLVRDYGVPADRVSVIPPGVDLARWQCSPRPRSFRARLLFVGGDFKRKGGELLLAAFREHLAGSCELDIVTRDEVDLTGLSGVRVHSGLQPNSPELRALYEHADLFVFPTLGDCLPLVIMEAMASGLPVVASRVGAIREEVRDGVTGYLVPPGDMDGLACRLVELVRDPDQRDCMGAAGRRVAEQRFDGARNYGALLRLCGSLADGAR